MAHSSLDEHKSIPSIAMPLEMHIGGCNIIKRPAHEHGIVRDTTVQVDLVRIQSMTFLIALTGSEVWRHLRMSHLSAHSQFH